MKSIGIVTGTRAEYGLLSRTIGLLQNSDKFDTRVFVCGAHLSPEHGYTISELESNEVKNIITVEMLLSSTTRVGIAKSVGIATMSFADAFSRENLDAIIVLGDRYEALAAAQASMFLDIPLIHIHGGEITEGAFDDAIRHSITKMANIHFPATKEFAKRISQLGEQPESIFVVGAPGIDNILNTPRIVKERLEEDLGFKLKQPMALVTYHPVTKNENENDITPLVNAIKKSPQLTYVITFPNADGEGKRIMESWRMIAHLENVHIVPSLGFIRYLSLMEYVDCVIGNSSSGIIEAPSLNVATVNIGCRQLGRPRADSIIDVSMDESDITDAISKCCDIDFKKKLGSVENPYGKSGAAYIIVKHLLEIKFHDFKVKKFKDHHVDE